MGTAISVDAVLMQHPVPFQCHGQHMLKLMGVRAGGGWDGWLNCVEGREGRACGHWCCSTSAEGAAH